jgi:hypothetical protein
MLQYSSWSTKFQVCHLLQSDQLAVSLSHSLIMCRSVWNPQAVLQLKNAEDRFPEWHCLGKAEENSRCGWTLRSHDLTRIRQLLAGMSTQMPDEVDHARLLELARLCLCAEIHRNNDEAGVIYKWTTLLEAEAARLRRLGVTLPSQTPNSPAKNGNQRSADTDFNGNSLSPAYGLGLHTSVLMPSWSPSAGPSPANSSPPTDIYCPTIPARNTSGLQTNPTPPASELLPDIQSPPPTAAVPFSSPYLVGSSPTIVDHLEECMKRLNETQAQNNALLEQVNVLVERLDELQSTRRTSLLPLAWAILCFPTDVLVKVLSWLGSFLYELPLHYLGMSSRHPESTGQALRFSGVSKPSGSAILIAGLFFCCVYYGSANTIT